MNVKDLKPGMRVIHNSWNQETSEPMLVKEVDGKIMLGLEGYPDTEPLDGGEDEEGWIEVK